VPNAFEPLVIVSDRFHVKPLLRSISFPQSCYALALAQKSVGVIEVSPDLPSTAVHVEGMPEDAGRAVRGAGEIGDWPRSPRPRLRASAGVRGAGGYRPSGRIQAVEGQKVFFASSAVMSTRRCARFWPAAASRWCWPQRSHWHPSIVR
jgi:hypothetical protein